ncbi:MAG: ABC transporter substrate-binding protein [Rickettsiales bacterium]|jgi:branched-chain amino acid transport system substrate-binding protein|nr:ABC transporter substrate-binding protein [Rickettsiales bacterium]
MKKLLIAICAAFALVACDDVPKSDKPIMKIGLILPLSGSEAEAGQGALRGAQMAIAEINANPDNKFAYKVIAEDAVSDVKNVPPIYNKLKNIDHVDAIYSIMSAIGLVVKDLATNDKILHITSSSNESIADNKFNWLQGHDSDQMFGVLAKHLKSRGVKTIAVAAKNDASTAHLVPLYTKNFNDNGLKIVSETFFANGERDFATDVQKIKQLNPDIVYLHSEDPEQTIFTKALRQGGYTGPITGAFMFVFAHDLTPFDGVEFVDRNGNPTDEFTKKFTDEFKIKPNSLSGSAYDSVMITYRAVEKYGRPSDWDAGDVRGYIERATDGYFGANGRVSLNDAGIMYTKPVMKVIRAGTVSEIK